MKDFVAVFSEGYKNGLSDKEINNQIAVVTIEDCLDNYEKEGKAVILENGQVTGFEKEGVRVES